VKAGHLSFQQNATLKNTDICIFKYATHISM